MPNPRQTERTPNGAPARPAAPPAGALAPAAPAAPAAPDRKESPLQIMKRDVVDVVGDKIGRLIEAGDLHLPADYSASNALKAAWLALQVCEDRNHNKALDVCTPDSIANALLDMVVQGLTPARSQCYFIVYGKRLLCQRSYFGSIALLRRIYGQSTEVWAEAVYEGDEFEYEIARGQKRIVKHVQRLGNINTAKILAAYAIVVPGDGRPEHVEVMTIDQIRRAWAQGATGGTSPAHKNFTEEMAKKSVISRAGKVLMNAASDAHLVIAARRQELSAVGAAVAERIEAGGAPPVLAIPPEAGDEDEPGLAAQAAAAAAAEPGVGEAPVIDVSPVQREPGADDEPQPEGGQLKMGPGF